MNVYKLFLFLCFIIYCIPSFIQLPFRILFLLLINLITIKAINNRIISIFPVLFIFVVYVIWKFSKNTFDSSLLIILFSIIPVYFFGKISFKSFKRNHIPKSFFTFIIICILFQLALFSYEGRPNLSYEINQSGSYLFLLYLIFSLYNYKIGKISIVIFSFLLLSRLLILCIILYEFLNYIRKSAFYERLLIRFKPSFTKITIISYVLIVIFSFWFVVNLEGNLVEGSNDASRLMNLNDGSNYLRFKINSEIIYNLFTNSDSKLLLEGYGNIAENLKYMEDYSIMPHNELIKSIAQFGIVFTVVCYLISRKGYNSVVSFNNFHLIIPLIVYTLILWVRFCIVPSIEMILILMIFKIKNIKDYENSNSYI